MTDSADGGTGDFVLTFATEGQASQPRSFHRPPALATTAPSHAWLASPLNSGRLSQTESSDL